MPGAGLGPMMQNMYMNGSFESQGMGMNMNMMGGGRLATVLAQDPIIGTGNRHGMSAKIITIIQML